MSSRRVDGLLRAVDDAWSLNRATRVRLDIIGATALTIGYGHERGTRDCDVLDADVDRGEVRAELLRLAGKKTSMAIEHAMYVEVLSRGIPLLPHAPRWNPVPSLSELVHFEVRALDGVDVVVSKLKRFHENDRDDVDWMIANEFVPHDEFVARFRSAVDEASHSAIAHELPAIIDNFHLVERDHFGILRETPIDLPDWI